MNPAFITLLSIAGGVLSGVTVQLIVDWRRSRRVELTHGEKIIGLTKDISSIDEDFHDLHKLVYRIKGAVEASTGVTIGNGIDYRRKRGDGL